MRKEDALSFNRISLPDEAANKENALTSRPPKIYASVMCANWRNLEQDMRELEEAGIDGFHFDIMDGHFVPNFTMGVDLMRALRPVTDLPFDVHMMVEKPEHQIEQFAKIGVESISVHVESTPHPHRAIQCIKDAKIAPIVALNPATPLDVLDYLWDDIWAALIMTVNPGFAGQRAVPSAIDKISHLSDLIRDKASDVLIQVDGNVSLELAPKMVRNGADMLVGGSSGLFLKGMSHHSALQKLRQAILD